MVQKPSNVVSDWISQNSTATYVDAVCLLADHAEIEPLELQRSLDELVQSGQLQLKFKAVNPSSGTLARELFDRPNVDTITVDEFEREFSTRGVEFEPVYVRTKSISGAG